MADVATIGWILWGILLAPARDDSPEVLDARLKLQLIAREPEIVTPIALDIDERGRIWVIESHTHFPKADYAGARSDRVLIFADPDRNGRAGSRKIFAEGFRHEIGRAHV